MAFQTILKIKPWLTTILVFLLLGGCAGVSEWNRTQASPCQYIDTPVLYFGHPVAAYNSGVEAELVEKIKKHFPGWHVENPNQLHHQEGYRRWKKETGNGMNYYFKVVLPKLHGGIFLPYRDGKWGAGVYGEALFIFKQGCPIWEVKPDGTILSTDPESMRLQGGTLSIFETGTRNKMPY